LIKIYAFDILSASNATEIPKTHDLGFCFFPLLAFRNRLYSKGVFGLMFAPQTIPASPAVVMCRKPKRNSYIVLILGMFAIALSSFPSLPICLRRQFYWTSLVRLSESIVAGGSMTIDIVAWNLLLQCRLNIA